MSHYKLRKKIHEFDPQEFMQIYFNLSSIHYTFKTEK